MSASLWIQVEAQLSRVDRPLTVSEIGRLLEPPPSATDLRAALDDAAAAGKLSRWAGHRYGRAPGHGLLRPVLVRVLDAGPKTRSQLQAALPAAFRPASPGHLTRALHALVSEGAIYSDDDAQLARGQDRGVKFYREDPVERLCAALDETLGEGPVPVAEIPGLTPKPPQKLLAKAIGVLVERGRLHAWPTKKPTTVSRRAPAAWVAEQLDRALAAGPATETELKARLPVARYLSTPVLRAALAELRRQRRLWQFKDRRRTLYGTRAQAMTRALADVEKRFDLSAEDLAAELRGRLPSTPPPPASSTPPPSGVASAREPSEASRDTDASPESVSERLWADIQRLAEKSPLSTLSISELRKLSSLGRSEIDGGLLSLRRAKRIALYEHDYPRALEPELQDALLRDDEGRAYNAFIIREPS